MDVAVSFHGNHAVYGEHLAKRYLDNHVLSHACGVGPDPLRTDRRAQAVEEVLRNVVHLPLVYQIDPGVS